MHRTSHLIIIATLITSFTVMSCGGDDKDAPRVTVLVVGPAGATIDGPEGMTLMIPPGALETNTEVKITATDILVPQITQKSSVISVEPVNTVFKKPSQIVMPFSSEPGDQITDFSILRAPRPGAAVSEWVPRKSVVKAVAKEVEADVMETGYFVVGINPHAAPADTDSDSESDTETASDTDTGSTADSATATDSASADPVDSDTASEQGSDTPADTSTTDTDTADTETVTDSTAPDTATACPTLPSGSLLFDLDAMGGSEAFQLYGDLETTFEWGPISGQSFNGAVRVTTAEFSGLPADIQVYREFNDPIGSGDHLALEFWTRCVSSVSCRTSAVLGESAGSNLTIAAYYATASDTWTQHLVPFISPGDFSNANYLSFHMGYANQGMEIGGVRLINYGQVATPPRPDCLPDNTELYTAVAYISVPAEDAYPGFIYNHAVEINGYPRPDVTYASGPSWLTFDSNTLLLSGVPPLSALDTTEMVTISADGVDQSWSINVTEAPGTVGHWPFDESQGTLAADASTNAHSAAVYGDAVWQVDGGHMNGAITLDSYTGTLDYVELPSDTDTALNDLQYSSYSISAWVKPNREPAGASVSDNFGASGIVLKRAEGGLYTGLYYSKDQLFIATHAFNARGYGAYAGPYETGEWHHVTSVCDLENSMLTLYVDGVAQYTGPLTPPADDTDTSPDTDYSYGTTPWRIGLSEANVDSGGMYGDITVDDVRFFSRALTASEIRNLQH